MPVKARRAKPRAHRITPAAVDAYRAALMGRQTRTDCIRGIACLGDRRSQCPTCLEYHEASNALHRELGLKPWQPSPLEADTPEPPRRAGPGDAWRIGWPLARALRAELEEETED